MNSLITQCIRRHPAYLPVSDWLLVAILSVFACSAVYVLGFQWIDQQRIAELVLFVLIGGLVWCYPLADLPAWGGKALAAVLALGVVSSLFADYSLWALREWACYAGLLLLALLVARRALDASFVSGLCCIMAAVALANGLQFLLRYAAAFLSGRLDLTPAVLMTGFSNIRFLGQFQVLAMPVLAWLCLSHWHAAFRYARLLSMLCFVALAVQWCIAFTLGGRGMFVALAVSHLALLGLFWRHWRLLAVQLAGALAGALLFLVLLVLVPYWLGIPLDIHPAFRDGLSGRGVIWMLAWHIFMDNPWLGAGPMQFAAHINVVAAHPHQVVLQWLAEWGLPATLLALGLATWGMWRGLVCVRKNRKASLEAAVWLSVAGALVLAQVDGVFVMPYTQVWLAVLVGIALGRWQKVPQAMVGKSAMGWRLLSIPVALLSLQILITQVPHLGQLEKATQSRYAAGLKPRFWAQGWIPMGCERESFSGKCTR